MDVVLLLGRVLFGALFVTSAVGHLTQTQAMAGYAASRGVPMAMPATLLSGVQILLGGTSVVLGVWGDLGSLLLVVFLAGTAVLTHAFWRETEAMNRQTDGALQQGRGAGRGGAGLLLGLLQRPGTDPDGPPILKSQPARDSVADDPGRRRRP